jgi:esterase
LVNVLRVPLLAHDRVFAEHGHVPGFAVVFLHGILGSRNNWRGFARRLLERDPRWAMVLVDLRNHGESHGFLPPHDITSAAADVEALVASMRLSTWVLVGHSYGGKVALEVARRGAPHLAEVWSLDSTPGVRSFEAVPGVEREVTLLEELDRVLRAVRRVPVPLASRAELVDRLQAEGLSDRLAQWMTTNLRSTDAGLVWKFALEHIPEMLASFGSTDLWPFIVADGGPRRVLVRGGRSDRWSPAERARVDAAVKAGKLTDHLMAEAGHWLHTDDPDGLLTLLEPALRRIGA